MNRKSTRPTTRRPPPSTSKNPGFRLKCGPGQAAPWGTRRAPWKNPPPGVQDTEWRVLCRSDRAASGFTYAVRVARWVASAASSWV